MERAGTSFVLCVLVGAIACGGTDATGGGGGGGGGGGYGFQHPAIELTINGTHFGPGAPDPGSGASLETVRDPMTASASQSTLQIFGSSTAGGGACQFGFQRFGTDIAAFHAAGYTISSASATGATGDGTAAPAANESVTVAQGTWACSGSVCDGAALVLTELTADHVQGSLSGTFQSSAGLGAASVVCSFYLPMSSYVP